MKIIYYIVSGVNMEILRFLLSFFAKEYGGDFKPLIDAFAQNDFDIKRVINNLDLEKLAPIIQSFIEKGAKNRPTDVGREAFGLAPIAGIADKDIVYTLNKYFYS